MCRLKLTDVKTVGANGKQKHSERLTYSSVYTAIALEIPRAPVILLYRLGSAYTSNWPFLSVWSPEECGGRLIVLPATRGRLLTTR